MLDLFVTGFRHSRNIPKCSASYKAQSHGCTSVMKVSKEDIVALLSGSMLM